MSEEKLSKKHRNKIIKLCLILVIAVSLFILNAGLIRYSVVTTVLTAHEAYEKTLGEQSNETYQKYYQMSYDNAEKKNHVSNRATIEVQSLKETLSLEVLRVSDVAYIYDENDTRLWTAVYGYGVYTVDLQHSEILVDNERGSVLVRIPYPRLNRANLDYDDGVEYTFKDGVFNGCISDGINAARDDLREAHNELQRKLGSSQLYYTRAETSARELITSMIKSLNAEIPDLVVEVEFID